MKNCVSIKRLAALLLALLMALQTGVALMAEEYPDEYYSVTSQTVEGANYADVVFLAPEGENGEQTKVVTRTVETGTALGELPEAPVREGYSFTAWQTEDGKKVTSETIIDGDMVLVASYNTRAYTAEYEDDRLSLVVRAPEGALPADVTVVLQPAELTEQQRTAVMNAIRNSTTEILDAIDIHFLNSAGEKVQPKESVHISMSMKEKRDGYISVVHLSDPAPVNRRFLLKSFATGTGSVSADVVAEEIAEQEFSFNADSFSVYVVAGYVMETVMEAGDGNTYKISVTFREDAQLPDDATLSAAELEGEDCEEYLGRAAVSMNAGGFAYGRVFDISILDGEGRKVQPDVPVDVTVELIDAADPNTDFSVIHFDEEAGKTELIDAESDSNTVHFSAGSFSAYAIVQGPEAIPLGWKKISSMDELTLLGEQGLYIGHTDGYYVKDNLVNDGSRIGIGKTKPAASAPGSEAVMYYFEPAGADNQFYIRCSSNNRYVKCNSGTRSLLFADSQADASIFTIGNNGEVFTMENNGWYWNMQGSANGTRFCIYNENNSDSKFNLWYNQSVVTDPYHLDGKTYGLLTWNGGVTGKALMAVSSGSGALKAKPLTVMTKSGDYSNKLFVPNDSDISMWKFEWEELDRYYVSSDGKYLKIDGNSISLTESKDDACLIQVVPGTGIHEGEICLKANGKTLTYSGNIDNGYVSGGATGMEWLHMVDFSELTTDYFRIYTAEEVSSYTPQDGDSIIVYCRVWNEITEKYDFYAIDHDGTLVPCYESSNELQWVGPQLNSMLWQFTEYRDDNGDLTYYYELKNPYSGNFIAPQMTGGQIFSSATIGINLNGRRSGAYYTTIVAWDKNKYAYSCLKADPETGKIVSIPYTDASLTRDAVDFAFAIVQDLPVDDTLHTVSTLDHTQYGITMKIKNFKDRTSMSDFLGNNEGGVTTTLQQGLLSTNLVDNYPLAKGGSFATFFSGATEVNHLFIESTYRSSGYFTFDSTQNFASLNGQNFTVYKELGTYDSGGNKPTLKHGQFFPFNQLTAGSFASVNGENLYSATAKLLSDSNPRKHEKLYLIKNVDCYFGVELEASFVQTPDGLDAWGHDIIYEFTGDDDFWLYVDGELVIDLGGIHSAVPGTINYRTGQVNVNGVPTTLRELFKSNYIKRNPKATETEVTAYLKKYFKDGTSVFHDNSIHTMRIFYLERGAGASNLWMRFNLASVKPYTVLLSKELEGAGSSESVTAEFPYQIYYKIDDDHGELLFEGEAKVTYKETNQPVKFMEQLDIDGILYENVYLIEPGQKAEIDFSDLIAVGEDIQYRIVECGVNTHVYGPVKVNGTVIEGTAIPDHENRMDFKTDYDWTKKRATIEYVNTVKERPSLTITKRLFSRDTDTDTVTELTGYDDDDAPFAVRLYLGTEYDSEPSPTYMYVYHVKNPDGEYCRFDDTIQQFVSLGETDFSLLDTEKQGSATFNGGIWGSITQIPAGYQVELLDVLPGTKFKVEERDYEIPDSYEFWKYLLDDEVCEGLPSGTVEENDVKIEVWNLKGNGLRVYKTWSDADYMEDRDPVYFAVFMEDEGGNLQLVDGSVRQMAYSSDPDSQTIYWYYGQLDASLDKYSVWEVIPDGSYSVDENGRVTGYDNVTRIGSYESVELTGRVKGAEESAALYYSVVYEEAEQDDNLRIFRVSNERKGIILKKTDWAGNPLAGAAFTLTEGDNVIGTFTSDNEGQITEAFLRSGVEYTLTETVTPKSYHGLQSPMTIRLAEGELVIGDADELYYTVTPGSGESFPVLTIKNRPFTLKVLKTDADTGEPLAGAHFALHAQKTVGDVTTIDLVPMQGYEDLVSGNDGVIPMLNNQLPAGTYELRETATPENYQTLPAHTRFTISTTGVVSLGTHPDGVTLTAEENAETGAIDNTITVANEHIRGTLTIKKTANGLQGTDTVPGDTLFTVKSGNDTYTTFTYGLMTEVDGVKTKVIENVPINATYSVEESGAAVDGYQLETVIGAAVTLSSKNTSGTIAVTNTYSLGSLTITKAFAGAELTDAQKNIVSFKVEGPNGYSETFTYGDMTNGSKTLTGLKLGEYTVTETAAIDGYKLTMNPESGSAVTTLSADKMSDTLAFTNTYELAELTITKAFAGAELTDAQKNIVSFKVEGPNGYSREFTYENMTNGSITLTGLKLGEYTVTEDAAIDGYKLTMNPASGSAVTTLSADKMSDTLAFTNTYELAELTITKAFAGAELTDAQKNIVSFKVKGPNGYSREFTYENMTNGSITLTGLKLGEYTVTETAAIDGYKLTMNPASGIASTTLSADKMSDTLAFTNTYELAELTITKAFAGAELTDDQKNIVSFKVDGPNGYSREFTYENMTNGSYTLTGVPIDATYSVTESGAEVTGYKLETSIGSAVTLSSTKMEGTIAVTNTYSRGSLTITKSATGLQDNDAVPANTTFTVKSGETTYATIKYSEMTNGSYTLNNVPIDATYSVTESGADVRWYDLSTTIGNPVTLTSENTNGEIEVKNVYTRKTSIVDITKIVSGNMGDRSADFSFTAKFEMTDGTTRNETFSLKHNGHQKYENIPWGTKVTITEDATSAPGYTTSSGLVANDLTENQHKVTIDKLEDAYYTVTFENNKKVQIDTGVPMTTSPYLFLLGLIPLAGLGAVLAARKRRRDEA